MSDLLKAIENLPDISFIDDISLEDLIQDMVNDYQERYEELTGKKITLAKADPNRLILYACGIQIYQGFQFVDRSGKQDLLKYSYAEHLDHIGVLKGVIRSPAQPARVTVRFTLSEIRPSVVSIPEGTRVAAGNIYFESTTYNEISIGTEFIDIEMECMQSGIMGNDFLPGEITTLVDPIAYVAAVINMSKSSGGAEIESDESLAERIYLAPSGYGIGTDDAYIYWVKSYSSNIADVGVDSPSACLVDIRFILTGGELPNSTFIEGLQDYLSNSQKKIKALTDLITVDAPDVVEYSINLTYWIDSSDASNAISIQDKVNSAISNFITWQNSKIGRDINPSELTKRIMAAGAKRVEITYPVFTEVTDQTAIAQLTTQAITYGGLE